MSRNYVEPSDRIFVHHEGAGDTSGLSFGTPFYSGGVADEGWRIYRTSVLTDISTKGFNGHCGIVFAGNRMNAPVSDADLANLTGLVRALRHRNFVTANPVILPHRLTPDLDTGTVCPGVHVYPERWSDVCLAIARGLGWTPEGPPEEDPVAQSVIVYPAAKLPNGPFKGKQPQCHGVSGTAALDHLTKQQVDTLKGAEIIAVELPLSMWLDEDGVDRHLYRLQNGKLVSGTDKLPAGY